MTNKYRITAEDICVVSGHHQLQEIAQFLIYQPREGEQPPNPLTQPYDMGEHRITDNHQSIWDLDKEKPRGTVVGLCLDTREVARLHLVTDTGREIIHMGRELYKSNKPEGTVIYARGRLVELLLKPYGVPEGIQRLPFELISRLGWTVEEVEG